MLCAASECLNTFGMATTKAFFERRKFFIWKIYSLQVSKFKFMYKYNE